MTRERWLPLSVRNRPEAATEFDILYEEATDWLRRPLLAWIRKVCGDQYAAQQFNGRIRDLMQLALRTEIPRFVDELAPDLYLDVIDFAIHRLKISEFVLAELEMILSSGGSAWRVTPRSLELRVGPALHQTAEAVFKKKTRPSQYLADSWHKAWGRNPDPSGAYHEAVRAVEATYAPIVSPHNERATLGTIIADINSKPSKFSARLQADEPVANVQRLAGMLQMLWKSQFDRHGTGDESVPLNVSIDEARDAVALATTLVHLAQQGGFSANGN